MAIEDTKRWHWVVIGLVAGVALSYAWNSMDPPPLTKSTKPLNFENQLAQPPLKSGEANVANIVVFPPVDGAYRVEFDKRTPTADGKAWEYHRWEFLAETPYHPGPQFGARPTTGPAAVAGTETILTFLSRVSEKNKNVHYTYAWWHTTTWTFILWTAGCVIVIGGIWPTLLNLLIGAGFGGRREREPEYDLSRFGKNGKDEEKRAPKSTELSEEDLRRIREIEAKVEGALGLAPEPKPVAKEPEPEIRKLEGAPVDAPAVQRTPEEEKEYRGEFYPTARAKKK